MTRTCKLGRNQVDFRYPAWLPATVLLYEIRQMGCKGGLRRFRMFLRSLEAIAVPEAVVRFETEAAQQMQADWIVFRRGKSYPISHDS